MARWRRRAAVAGWPVLVGALVLTGCSGTDRTEPEASNVDASEQDVEESDPPPAAPPLTLELPVTAPARCATLRPSLLARADHAFGGAVVQASGGDVSLEVETWFAGERGDRVVVTGVPGAGATELFPDFAPGERYLVAAVGTDVLVCGYTDRWRPGLEDLYRTAFDGTA